MRGPLKHLCLLMALLVALAGFPALGAAQSAPANDNFAGAIEVGGIPFNSSADLTYATREGGEPTPDCYSWETAVGSVWYKYTPAETRSVSSQATGLGGYARLAVYTGSAVNSLSQVGCRMWSELLTFQAQAGTTYYFQVSSVYGYAGTVEFNLMVPPPPTASFYYNPGDPSIVSTVSFSNNSGDPAGVGISSCYWDFADGATSGSCYASHRFDSGGTYDVSLSVTTYDGRSASSTQTVTVRDEPRPPYASFDYYPGDPSTLSTVYFYNSSWDSEGVGISSYHWEFGDGATAGDYYTNHRFDSSGTYEVSLTVTTYDGRSASTTRTVTVSEPPPPVAAMDAYPSSPTVFDEVRFRDTSWDPAGVGGFTCLWDFGDGATSDVSCGPNHRYAKDGFYTVALTVTTADGRSAQTTRQVQVVTHDVAITKLTVPNAASSGQTKGITVGVNSNRYEEYVRVDLYKSIPGSWSAYDLVGTSYQTVPVRSANRTTNFSFNYTFTAEDAIAGKVTFKAVATVMYYGDAAPADNEAISSPVKISR